MLHYKLRTSPISQEEKEWCKKLEKLLPATRVIQGRLGLYTIGDCDAVEVERAGLGIEDCSTSTAELELGRLESRVNIHSLAG
jgi:hypothetical protein